MDVYLGEIRIFAGSFAPEGWNLCDGSLLQVSQYSALYALLGTTFGGNGSTTFGVPDLRGRLPVGQGTGPGLTARALAQTGGASQVPLSVSNLPAHSHTLSASNSVATATAVTAGAGLAQPPAGDVRYALASATPAPVQETMADASISMAVGGAQPHQNLMPYVALQYIICTQGLYPVKP